MTLWSDGKTSEEIQKLAEVDGNSVAYNLHEDLLCVKEDLAKANERVNNIINGDMTPEDYHKISGSKFVIEKKLKALDDLLEEIQCSVVVPRRYEQFQEPYLEGIKHCIQFIECQSKQLRKEQE